MPKTGKLSQISWHTGFMETLQPTISHILPVFLKMKRNVLISDKKTYQLFIIQYVDIPKEALRMCQCFSNARCLSLE